MTQSLGGFRAALLAGWIVLGAAGVLFARAKGIPYWAALPVLAAFLVEYPFYLVTGFAALRERLAGRYLPLWLTGSTLLPYLIAGFAGGMPGATGLVRLLALALALSLWYTILPASPWADAGYLVLIAAVLLGKYFNSIYTPPYPGVEVAILGHLALIRITAMVLLLERRVPGTGFGFIPSWREWRIGIVHYLYFAAAGFPLALAIHALRPVPPAPAWKVAATFLAILWVVALSEEFFFRGVLQHWLEDWTGRGQAALVLTSLLYGLAHLPFRGFPNWRWVFLTTLLGYACGRARNLSGGIRAGMVTHALAVATWRAFFA